MGRRPSLFTEADLKRAIRATMAAGVEIGGIEIDRDGRIVIRPARQAELQIDRLPEIRL